MNKKLIFVLSILSIMLLNTLNASILNNIQNSKSIKVGVIITEKPFIYKNRSGKIVGYEMDLVKELAKEMGVKIRIVPLSKSKIMSNLNNNNVDIVIGSIIHTHKLDKQIDFSITYFYNGHAIIGKETLSSYNIDSLLNKSIGVIENSVNFKVLEVIQPLAKLKKYKNFNSMLDDLKNNKIDAISSNYGKLLNVIKSQNNNFKIIGNPYTIEPYGILLKENDSKLRDIINLAIQNTVKNGEYNKIYKRWFKKNPIRNIPIWP